MVACQYPLTHLETSIETWIYYPVAADNKSYILRANPILRSATAFGYFVYWCKETMQIFPLCCWWLLNIYCIVWVLLKACLSFQNNLGMTSLKRALFCWCSQTVLLFDCYGYSEGLKLTFWKLKNNIPWNWFKSNSSLISPKNLIFCKFLKFILFLNTY